jgi:hypothetical protein
MRDALLAGLLLGPLGLNAKEPAAPDKPGQPSADYAFRPAYPMPGRSVSSGLAWAF